MPMEGIIEKYLEFISEETTFKKEAQPKSQSSQKRFLMDVCFYMTDVSLEKCKERKPG